MPKRVQDGRRICFRCGFDIRPYTGFFHHKNESGWHCIHDAPCNQDLEAEKEAERNRLFNVD